MYCEVAKNEDIRGLLIGGKAFQAKMGVSSNVIPTQLQEKGSLTPSHRFVLAGKK